MKILNLYSGIGGNRKLWSKVSSDIEVTAVEFDKNIAKAYQDRFPKDEVIIGCAKEYLFKNFRSFDFIWASPPCQTHTRLLHSQKDRLSYLAKYPDMSLYQIILFLQLHSNKFKYVVENVIPYYKPLIKPTFELQRHLFWSNFKVEEKQFKKSKLRTAQIKVLQEYLGINLDEVKIKNKRQILRNCVLPEIGKHILEGALLDSREGL